MKTKKYTFNRGRSIVAMVVMLCMAASLISFESVAFAADPLTIVSGSQTDYVIAVPDRVLPDDNMIDESKATVISAAYNLGITARYGAEAIKKVADSDSKVGYAAKITLSKFANDADRNLHKLPIPLRLYEWDRTVTPNKIVIKSRAAVERSMIDPSKEGTYQLYKGPSFKLPQDVHFTIFTSEGINAKGQFMPNDGVLGGTSGDEYDIYVSMKFEGPEYITGSTKEDAVYIDRVLVVKRVQPTAEDESQDKVELTAAKELQAYIDRISGVKLDIVKESSLKPGDKAIMVGHTSFAKSSGIEPAGREEWAIKAIDNKLVITGEGKRGALYGVYHLLEDELGVRWWNPWEELVPTNSLIQIDSSIDRNGKPAFFNRHIREGLQGYTPFYARNRMNTVWQTPLEYGSYERWGKPGNSHTFLLYLPPAEYFDEHPEYFSEINGVRQKDKSQICLTNPDVKNIFIEKLRGYIKSSYAEADAVGDSRPEFFVINQNDWYGSCTCANCAPEVAKKGESGLMLTFVNDIADAVKDEYPEVKLETFAYLYTLEAPKDGTVPRNNVVVMLADLEVDILHDLQHGNSKSQYSLQVLNDWSKLLMDNGLENNLKVWYYTLNMGYVAPMQAYLRVAKDFKLYHEKGVKGFFLENEQIFSSDMWDLVEWVAIKLQEDPYQDIDLLIKTFTDGYYGAEAGALIREYLSLVANEVEQSNLTARYTTDTHTLRIISVETVLKSDKLFEQALEKVKGNTIYTRRINAARNSLNRYIAFQFDYLKQSAQEKGLEFNLDRKAALDRLVVSFAEIREQRVDNDGPVKYIMSATEQNQEEYIKYIAGDPTNPGEDNTESKAEKATGIITIDGALDEVDWSLDKTLPEKILMPVATTLLGKTWDNEYLYVAFDVTDPEVKSIPTDNAPYNGDGVEVFIDGDLAKGNYNEHSLHLIFRWNDDKVYNFTAFGGSVKEEMPPEGIKHKMIRTDKGYTAEIAIPWSAIGLNVSEGKRIGFTAHLNDMGTDSAGNVKLLGVRGFTPSLKVGDAANSSGWSDMQLVSTAKLDKVMLTSSKTVLKPADSELLSVCGIMDDGSPANLSNAHIIYATDNTQIVKVDSSGNITAVGEGTANVKVSVTLDSVVKDSSVQVIVDGTPPISNFIAVGTMKNDWYSSDVTIALSATDNLAGLDKIEYRFGDGEEWITYTAPLAMLQEGNYILQYRSADKAGNVENIMQQTVKIDKMAPSFNLIVNGNIMQEGNSFDDYLPVTFKAWDVLSGVASARITIDDTEYSIDPTAQSSMDINLEGKAGSRMVTVTVQDIAGNTLEKTFLFTVTTSIDSMRYLIDRYANSGELSGPLLNQLINSLDQAQHQLDKGRPDQAAKHMGDFIKYLNNEALQGKVKANAKVVLNADAEALYKAWIE